jgi:hypothetical protein
MRLWNWPKNLGMLLLGIWLILTGIAAIAPGPFANLGLVLGGLAIAAGVLLLMGR